MSTTKYYLEICKLVAVTAVVNVIESLTYMTNSGIICIFYISNFVFYMNVTNNNHIIKNIISLGILICKINIFHGIEFGNNFQETMHLVLLNTFYHAILFYQRISNNIYYASFYIIYVYGQTYNNN